MLYNKSEIWWIWHGTVCNVIMQYCPSGTSGIPGLDPSDGPSEVIMIEDDHEDIQPTCNDWSMPCILVEQCDVSTRLLIDQFYGVSEQPSASSMDERESTAFLVPALWAQARGSFISHHQIPQRLEVNARKLNSNRLSISAIHCHLNNTSLMAAIGHPNTTGPTDDVD
ncbi:uncharacterized protein P174DRAFT_150422 [Aspergillus novofumigatus IBT 16806]|uniref:Uncharacterized protein n=1 Tax=Aspergillus novofumigatus (strain IBT 16806) TaxID=1392255 RepID=A0A2I1CEI2_ASPN1|nr:uncharacterized protein P174DRAFT_150422 [Aspergillus novofumigatus IBT 16806]PKX96008.1 hypothetical protein P174DRAFT_150422 [Aspergillus novofumigatus IBT 16806]